MRTKHTPGPWIQVGHWVEHPDETVAEICTCDPKVMGQGHFQRKDAEIVANARLIAAAPEMLECLRLIENEYLVLPAHEELIMAVIAKATGETQ